MMSEESDQTVHGRTRSFHMRTKVVLAGAGYFFCFLVLACTIFPAVHQRMMLAEASPPQTEPNGTSEDLTNDSHEQVAPATPSFDEESPENPASYPEVWNRTYPVPGDECSTWIVATEDGYVISGHSSILLNYSDLNFSDGDIDRITAMKIDRYGGLVWNRTYTCFPDATSTQIVPASAGGFLIVGESWGGIPSPDEIDAPWNDICCLRIDGEGNLVWARSYPMAYDQAGVRVANCLDGGFLLTANQASLHASDHWQNTYALKIDASGNPVWENTFSGGFGPAGKNDTMISHLTATPDGGFLLVGTCRGWDSKSDVYLLRIDGAGHKIWDGTYGRSGVFEYGWVVLAVDGTGFLVGGKGAGEMCFWMFDPQGKVVWEQSLPMQDGWLCGIVQGQDGYIIAGSRYNQTLLRDRVRKVFAGKIDQTGNPVWDKDLFEGSLSTVVRNAEGGFVIVGETPGSVSAGGRVYTLDKDVVVLQFQDVEIPVGGTG